MLLVGLHANEANKKKSIFKKNKKKRMGGRK
jgi:hypothetical protein